MSSLADWFSGVVTAIKNLPALIFGAFETALDAIKSGISALGDLLGTVGDLVFSAFKTILSNIVDGILSIPEKVGEFFSNLMDFVKGIFVPKQEDIDECYNKLDKSFDHLLVTYDLSGLVASFEKPKDITVTLYGQDMTLLKMDWVLDAVGTFRAIIRGFICLLLVLFNVNQFLSLIGQPTISIVGALRQDSDGSGKNELMVK